LYIYLLQMSWSGTGRSAAVLLLAFTALSGLTAASNILEYFIFEEMSPGYVVGDLVNDFGFADDHDQEAVKSLRFSVLKQPPYDRRFFAFNESSGKIVTTHRIDRELICRGDDHCVIKFDVAVKPMRYFKIIKVSPQPSFFSSCASCFGQFAFRCEN